MRGNLCRGLTPPITSRLATAPIFASHLIEKIRELKERDHLTVLMAEQNINQAARIANRDYIIVKGGVEFTGSKAELQVHKLVKRFYLGTE